MDIRRHAASRLSVKVSLRHVLACGVVFAVAQVAACGSRVSVGHGQADVAGMGGSSVLPDHAAQGGSGSTMASAGGVAPGDGSAGLGSPGAQAGGPAGASCTGSLAAVNRALEPTCPVSLCEARAWAATSCSSPSGVLGASEQYCADRKTISFDLGDGVTKTCVYTTKALTAPNGGIIINIGSAAADGDLVGVLVTDVRERFCEGASKTISAGELPATVCTNSLRPSCQRATNSGDAGASNGDAGASNSGAPEEPVRACFDNLSGTCQPCCPASPPDCSDKPDGYPGYGCSPSWGSYCSCSCNRGQWICPC